MYGSRTSWVVPLTAQLKDRQQAPSATCQRADEDFRMMVTQIRKIREHPLCPIINLLSPCRCGPQGVQGPPGAAGPKGAKVTCEHVITGKHYFTSLPPVGCLPSMFFHVFYFRARQVCPGRQDRLELSKLRSEQHFIASFIP